MDRRQNRLPSIIAGPILRRLTENQLVIWLVASHPLQMTLCLYHHADGHCLFEGDVADYSPAPVRIGEHAYVYLIDYESSESFPVEQLFEYDLLVHSDNSRKPLRETVPVVVYDEARRPVIVVKPQLNHVLHGSCRKPHYPSKDALLRIDRELSETRDKPEKRPDLLFMTGDQIYGDDVGGPMLVAIHQTIDLLGLYPEQLEGAVVKDSAELFRSELCYYLREELLPRTKETKTLRDRFFGGVRKPIFTAASAHNHLVTLAEVAAMYLLIWSPVLWEFCDVGDDTAVPETKKELFASEQVAVEEFAIGLSEVRRMLAHVPTYMIFDDHDVTDDWNLTRGWEEVAYAHPFSKRIIGNALIAYFLFQGWGNNPKRFAGEFLENIYRCFADPGGKTQDELIDYLLDFEHWNYTLPTTPKVVVLDTRTNRWWSESSLTKPSGLMDWEELSAMQQELMNQPAVLLVSPAPIFGVKLIEVVQRVGRVRLDGEGVPEEISVLPASGGEVRFLSTKIDT